MKNSSCRNERTSHVNWDSHASHDVRPAKWCQLCIVEFTTEKWGQLLGHNLTKENPEPVEMFRRILAPLYTLLLLLNENRTRQKGNCIV